MTKEGALEMIINGAGSKMKSLTTNHTNGTDFCFEIVCPFRVVCG